VQKSIVIVIDIFDAYIIVIMIIIIIALSCRWTVMPAFNGSLKQRVLHRAMSTVDALPAPVIRVMSQAKSTIDVQCHNNGRSSY